MCAPASSSARKEASSPVRRSGLAIAGDCPRSDSRRSFNRVRSNLQQRVECCAWRWTWAIRRPSGGSSRRTSAASTPPRCASSATPRRRRTSCRTSSCASGAARRLRRRRGEIGPYLRMMAPLARAGPVARRPGRRPRLGPPEGRRRAAREARSRTARRRRRARRHARGGARGAAAPAGAPARGARARLLGRPDRRPDRPPRAGSAGHRQEPHPARAGSGCARNALHWRSKRPRRFATIERPFDRRAGRARCPAGWGTVGGRGPMAGGRHPQAPGRTYDNRRRTSP